MRALTVQTLVVCGLAMAILTSARLTGGTRLQSALILLLLAQPLLLARSQRAVAADTGTAVPFRDGPHILTGSDLRRSRFERNLIRHRNHRQYPGRRPASSVSAGACGCTLPHRAHACPAGKRAPPMPYTTRSVAMLRAACCIVRLAGCTFCTGYVGCTSCGLHVLHGL